MEIGKIILSNLGDGDMYDADKIIASMIAKFPSDELAPKKKEEEVGPNEDLYELFTALASKAQNEGEGFFKVKAKAKAALSLRGCEYEITSGSSVSKGKGKLAGVGKSSGETIDWFLEFRRSYKGRNLVKDFLPVYDANKAAEGSSSPSAKRPKK